MNKNSVLPVYRFPTSTEPRRKVKFCQGPRRVIFFCLFALFLPSTLIALPLLMRFVFYGYDITFLAPSDMRIMDSKISTIWCQGEEVKSNTTFTAYLNDDYPELKKSDTPMKILKHLKIPDDQKEYWGFYLLKGTTFRINVCSSLKGASVLIVKGRNTLHHCAYVGEADSAGYSDEFSDSRSDELLGNKLTESFLFNIPHPQNTKTNKTSSFLDKEFSNKKRSSEEQNLEKVISKYLKELKDSKKLKKVLEMIMRAEKESSLNNNNEIININGTKSNEAADDEFKIQISNSNSSSIETNTSAIEDLDILHGKLSRRRRRRRNPDSEENGAFEEEDDEGSSKESIKPSITELKSKILGNQSEQNSIWTKDHNMHEGHLNFSLGIDGSNSESESSFSSSEEAMAKCENVIALFYLKPSLLCEDGKNSTTSNNDEEHFPENSLKYENLVNQSGYYYFIFGSENEIADNYLKTSIIIEKYVYDLPEPIEDCTGVKECNVQFSFGSSQKLVISVPKPEPNQDEIWNEKYTMESLCIPRTLLYLIFTISVPATILLCAFK